MKRFFMEKQLKPCLFRRARTSDSGNHRPQSQNISIARIVASMLGLAAPIIAGAATGHLQSGVAASLGGLLIGTQSPEGSPGGRLSAPAFALVSGSAAMFIGTTIAGQAFTGWFIVAFAAIAAFFGGISRPLARATTQFVIFLIIAGNMNATGAHPVGMTLLFAAGALWSSVLLLCLDRNRRTAAAPPPQYTVRQYLRYWHQNLRHWKGWQYVVRITVCLAAAEIIREIWPHDHSYWISLTVAIVVHRDLSAALTRTLQRALGTFLGVLLVSTFLLGLPPLWVIIAMVAVLAAARTILININYTAYTAAMTPLIILLLDFGRPISPAILANRLIATFAGCLIALIPGYLVWKKFADSRQNATPRKK